MYKSGQIFYRSYRFKMFGLGTLREFKYALSIELNICARIKKKHVRCIQSSFKNKELRETRINTLILHRTGNLRL